jgi:hypothetical protein
MKYEDFFPKPLEEMTEEELHQLAEKLRKERKYPAMTKAKDKKADQIDKLINKYITKHNAK